MDSENKELILQTIKRIEASIETLKHLFGETSDNSKLKSPKPKKTKIKSTDNLDIGPPPPIAANWPLAVAPDRIIKPGNQSQEQLRALQVAKIIDGLVPLKSKTILDVGCGNGYLAREISSKAKYVLGFDIKQGDWSSLVSDRLNVAFTTDEVGIVPGYDLIIMYDTLDHLSRVSPEDNLAWLRSLLNPEGVIYIRTHPWCSRHGGHLYEHDNGNRAFLHLAFTMSELANMGLVIAPNIKVVKPHMAYEGFFAKAGLKIVSKRLITEPVDGFFTQNPLILDRISKLWWDNDNIESVLKKMQISFIDYVLSANNN